MNYQKHTLGILLALFFWLSQSAQASHIYSTEITYRCIGGNQYIVELEVFQDCGGLPPATQLFINRQSTSCGVNNNVALPRISFVDATPICAGGTATCGSGFGFYKCIYSDTVSLAACSDWVISYSECCRSGAIVSIVDPTSTMYYSEITFNNTTTCNNSPEFTAPGCIYICNNTPYVYTPNAYDLDGDSLAFAMAPSLEGSGNNVNYLAGINATNPFGVGVPITFNPATGTASFTPNSIGTYIVAFRVFEYRNGVLIGSSYKDLTVHVTSCTNSAPTFTVSNVQGGVFEDNIFYVEHPLLLTFDIVSTDADAADILTFSSDILSAVGTFTTSGTNPATASFSVAVGGLVNPLEFMVQITDNHCYPTNTGSQQFGFSVIRRPCNASPIQAIVEADSILTICPTCALGTVLDIDTIYPPFTTTYGSLSFDGINCILYQAGSNYQVQESFWVYFGGNGGAWMDSIWVDITTVSCVWAGDADTSKTVNNFDLLPLGLGYGETGAVRANASLSYTCQPALDFANSTPSTNINYKHSDTDGNGVVNMNDTMAIVLNWGQVHLKNSSNFTAPISIIPFYVEPTTALAGQTVQIPIVLGDTAVLADSIYGVAFTINYDETMTDTGSVWVGFNTSWLGTINTDMMSIQKDFYNQGQIEVAIVRTDHTNRDGSGQIGTLNLTIKDDILKSTTQRLDLQISNVRIITNTETERTANTPLTGVMVTIINNTNNVENKDIQISVFPNPAQSVLHIQSNDAIQHLKLSNITGQELHTETLNGFATSISTQNLDNGMYILQVQTERGWSTQKVQIRK